VVDQWTISENGSRSTIWCPSKAWRPATKALRTLRGLSVQGRLPRTGRLSKSVGRPVPGGKQNRFTRTLGPTRAKQPGIKGNRGMVMINCDMGEAFGLYKMGDDESLMPEIDVANVACGFHGL